METDNRQDEDENMKIIETYGNYIEKWSNENPDRARWLLKTGWKAQNLKFRFAPDKRLMPADRYLARLMMDTMLMPLEKPQESAIVSILLLANCCRRQESIRIMWKDFPVIFLHQRQKEHFYSRQKIQEFRRHFAVIIRHLSGRHRRKCFRNQSALCTRT